MGLVEAYISVQSGKGGRKEHFRKKQVILEKINGSMGEEMRWKSFVITSGQVHCLCLVGDNGGSALVTQAQGEGS